MMNKTVPSLCPKRITFPEALRLYREAEEIHVFIVLKCGNRNKQNSTGRIFKKEVRSREYYLDQGYSWLITSWLALTFLLD